MKKEVSEPQLSPAEKLREIGNQLRQRRQKLDLSSIAISSKTKIRLHLLEAIEEGKIEALPEPIYVREFIKKYAEAVEYSSQEATALADAYPLNVSTAKGLGRRWQGYASWQLRPFHLYFLYIFLVVVSVKNLGHLLEPSPVAIPDQTIESLSAQKQPLKTTQPVAIDRSKTSSKVNAVKDEKLVTLEVTVKTASWLKIVVDGKTSFEGTLPQGSHRIWTGKQQVTVSTKNAGGILVAFNNGKARQLGKLGQPEEVTYKLKKPEARLDG
jgi:cytoskeletal protein RodZ